jgi:hypothetical protein
MRCSSYLARFTCCPSACLFKIAAVLLFVFALFYALEQTTVMSSSQSTLIAMLLIYPPMYAALIAVICSWNCKLNNRCRPAEGPGVGQDDE